MSQGRFAVVCVPAQRAKHPPRGHLLRRGVRSADRAIPLRLTATAAALFLLAAVALAQAPARHTATSSPAAVALRSHPALIDLPAPAQAAVSETLGAASPLYRAGREPEGFTAVNPNQHLSASFTRFGVSLRSGRLHLGLSLRAVSQGASVRFLPGVSPTAAADRVSYVHPDLSESYTNGPLGIEQVFTVPSPPDAHANAPLTLSLSLSGNARVAIAPDASSIMFAGPGHNSLRYEGLHATDAKGRALQASLALHARTVQLRIDTRHARYPLRIDPLIVQASKLASGSSQAGGLFGISVALSADGSTALIGAPGEGDFAGAVWVFVRSGSTWIQQGEALVGGGEGGVLPGEECEEEETEASESQECAFGRAVALSADGSTALIGAPRQGGHRGAAFLFTRSGSTWGEAATLTGGSEESGQGHLGRSVALSADGNAALLGAPGDHAYRGGAFLFTRSGESWAQQGAKLTGAGESGVGYFGRNLALSADGSTALLGAPGDAGHLGAAFLFARSGEAFAEPGVRLTGGEESGEGRFGTSTALSADGATALVGGRSDDGGLGAGWVFTRSGASFSQQGPKLTAAEEAGPGEFGFSAALSADGNTALLGGPRDGGGSGAAWVLTRSGGVWAPQGEKLITVSGTGKGAFGSSVALSGDGANALIGAPHDGRFGAVWALLSAAASSPVLLGLSPGHGPAAGATTVTISGHGFLGASAVMFGSVPAASFTVLSGGTIAAVSPAEAAGTVDVTVTTLAGSSATGLADLFTFRAPVGGGRGPREEPPAGTPAAGTPAGAGVVLGFSTVSAPPSACRVALASGTLRVRNRRLAALTLTRTGTGRCAGDLTLTVQTRTGHGAHRSSHHVIGAATFLIPQGKTQLVHISLTRTGRDLLGAAHGRLTATLLILRLSPAPPRARAATVRLAPARPHGH